MTANRAARPAPFTPEDVGALVRAATAAPSVHNSQPWRFRDREDRIELHLDVVLGELTHAADAEGAALDRIGSSCR